MDLKPSKVNHVFTENNSSMSILNNWVQGRLSAKNNRSLGNLPVWDWISPDTNPSMSNWVLDRVSPENYLSWNNWLGLMLSFPWAWVINKSDCLSPRTSLPWDWLTNQVINLRNWVYIHMVVNWRSSLFRSSSNGWQEQNGKHYAYI